jgi:hypothetical protein
MLGAIFATLAVFVLGSIALLSADTDATSLAGLIAGIAVLVGYIFYAQRRATALVKEVAALSRENADREIERLRASSALTTGVNVRWRARTYVACIVLLIGAATGAAMGWTARSGLLLVLSSLAFIWIFKTLLARLAEPLPERSRATWGSLASRSERACSRSTVGRRMGCSTD